MKNKILLLILLFSFFVENSICKTIPYLKKQGTATQLIVEGKPLLMLGGELGNSAAADTVNLKEIFPMLRSMELNTVLAPVYWELIEPKEGTFDFSTVDALIKEARRNDLKLVLLWFGSWKNSMSCYAPDWIKTNPKRFPYSKNSKGNSLEIMTAFSSGNLQADKNAFCSLLDYIKNIDEKESTVIMIQVENEIGMIPEVRDRIKEADKLFEQEVPVELMVYLTSNKRTLNPHVLERWALSGYSTKGNWQAVFGESIFTEEIFQAWHYARYVEEISKAGKSVYNLPMFVNAALDTRDRKPGQYPSGGPLSHLMDIWRAGAPSIDFFAPDIYDPPFDYWCQRYNISGNPLFIPETVRGDHTSARVFYAFGEHNAMGFCPFSIESTNNPLDEPLVKSYRLLNQITPMLISLQGQNKTRGFWFHPEHLRDTVSLGDFNLIVSHDYTLGWSDESKQDVSKWGETGCLIIKLADDEFMVAGTGIVITCLPKSGSSNISAGIISCDKGVFENGNWMPFQRLNGDETHQGRHIRIPAGSFEIQKFKLYQYK